MARALLVSSTLVLAFLASGCGTDDDLGASPAQHFETCRLAISLSGAVEQNLGWGDEQGCGGAGDAAAQIVVLGWGVGTGLNVKVTIGQIDPGIPGSYTGYVEVREAEKLWRSADGTCNLEITRFSAKPNDADSYELAGNGSCTGALDPIEGGAAGNITLGGFVFQSIAGY